MICHHIRLRYVRHKSTPSRQACSEHHVYQVELGNDAVSNCRLNKAVEAGRTALHTSDTSLDHSHSVCANTTKLKFSWRR